jgi:hypothetical protein
MLAALVACPHPGSSRDGPAAGLVARRDRTLMCECFRSRRNHRSGGSFLVVMVEPIATVEFRRCLKCPWDWPESRLARRIMCQLGTDRRMWSIVKTADPCFRAFGRLSFHTLLAHNAPLPRNGGTPRLPVFVPLAPSLGPDSTAMLSALSIGPLPFLRLPYADEQFPSTHATPSSQTRSHVPQCLGSIRRSRHVPWQHAWPLGQWLSV